MATQSGWSKRSTNTYDALFLLKIGIDDDAAAEVVVERHDQDQLELLDQATDQLSISRAQLAAIHTPAEGGAVDRNAFEIGRDAEGLRVTRS